MISVQKSQFEMLELWIESNKYEIPESFRALIPKLLSILEGERNPALADDLALHNMDAADLLYLLDRLKLENS